MMKSRTEHKRWVKFHTIHKIIKSIFVFIWEAKHNQVMRVRVTGVQSRLGKPEGAIATVGVVTGMTKQRCIHQ